MTKTLLALTGFLACSRRSGDANTRLSCDCLVRQPGRTVPASCPNSTRLASSVTTGAGLICFASA